MGNIFKSIICLFLIINVSSRVFSKDYKVAVFDYDIRPKNSLTVAKYIEKKLKKQGLKFREINQFTGKESQKETLKVLSNLEAANYDLIIIITSDAVIPAIHRIKKTPCLFTNVNNPKFFGIKNLNKPGRNISGVTYYVPVVKQVKFFKKLMGDNLNKIGIIFDEKAKSRRAEVNEFKTALKKLQIDYEIKLIKNKKQLPGTTKFLLNKNVDAVMITSSNKLYKNIGLILEMCTDKKVPIFSVNKKGVAQGAISAFASDYYQMVDECLIPMALDILVKGKNPATMPIRSLKKPSIYLNLTQARKINLKIPASVKKRASKTN